MNKITKLLIAVILGTAFVYGVEAARPFLSINGITKDATTGASVTHPGFDIKSYARFASTTEAVICTGRCLVYDAILSSGADGAYAILADTGTADGSGTAIVAKLEFDGTGHGSLSGSNPNAFPFVTTKGLTVDLSSVSGSEEVLILYKDLD